MNNFIIEPKIEPNKLLSLAFLLMWCVISTNNINAQTGPAGVGNANGNNGQPELALWLDASDIGLANDAAVSTWVDKSGNGLSLTQTGTARPTFKDATDANYNFPALRFDGSNDNLPFDGSILTNTNYTLIVVGARRSNGRNVVFGGTDAATNQNFHPYFDTNTLHSHHYGNDHNQNYTGGPGSTVNATTPNFGVFGFSLNSSLASAQRKIYQNGSQIDARDNGAQLISFNNASLGFYRGEYSELDLAEVIVYADALNDAELAIVNNYLAAKYGFSMDGNEYYVGDTPANGNYDFNLNGVGQLNGEQVTQASSRGISFTSNSTLDNNGEFILFADLNAANSISTADLGSGVAARWARTWFVDKTTAGTLGATISFDIQSGIGGDYPAGDVDNYVLLRENGGTYDIVPVTVGNKSFTGSAINFNVSTSDLIDGVYTLGTSNSADSPLDGQPNQTWYSYITGDWENPLTWTLDGSGLDRQPIGGGIPDATDNVVILTGRDVSITANDHVVASIEVNGVLDVAATSGHNFVNIAGSGKIRLSGAAGIGNFPGGSTVDFADDFLGGTVEYYGTGLSISDDRLFNHVEVNLTGSADAVVLLADLELNGDLTVSNGVFQINDNASTTVKSLTVRGNTSIEVNGGLAVGQGNTIGSFSIPGTMPNAGNYHDIFHQLIFFGDFTNQGTVRFTNQSAPVYNQFTSTGAATVIFKGATNNIASLFGTTDFYNLIIDKGTDQTYALEINASSTTNFQLFGPNNVGRVSNNGFTPENPEVRKALWIYNGTLHLTGSVEINSLSEGNVAGGNGDYPIGKNAALWIDGPSVAVYTTADNSSQVPTGSVGINTGGSNQALSLYGRFRISDGHFGTRGSAGFIFWNASAGEVVIEGGTVNVSQFRSAGSGNGTYTYSQSGGEVLVRANEGVPGETSGTYDLFSLDLVDAVFNMSGGTLTVYGNRGDAIFINSAEGNYNVTGGTVVVENRDADIATIASTVPFWNLIVKRDQAGDAGEIDLITCISGANTIVDPELRVLNDFTIESGINFDHNGNDVTVGSDFTIEAGANYYSPFDFPAGAERDLRKNTTSFIGSDNATLSFLNRTGGTGDEQRFWNFVVDRPAGKTLSFESGKANRTGNNNNLLRIDGDAFKVLSGTVDQGTHSIRVYADSLINYDQICVFNPLVTADADANGQNDIIKFRDDGGASTILITADTSRFGAVKLNSQDEIFTLNSDVKIDYLDHRHGRFDLQNHNLTIDYLDNNLNGNADWKSCGGCYSVEDMFITNGDVSNGGLSLYVPADGLDPADGDATFLFPIGIGTDGIDTDADGGASKYTPASITLQNVTDDGYITIRPVDEVLPTTNGNGGTMLSYYWRVSHEGFSTLPQITTLTFTGYEDDEQANPTTRFSNSWNPGKVLSAVPFSRTAEGDGINDPNDYDITFDGDGTPFTVENADYSAGPPNRFNGDPLIYYTKGRDRTNNQPLWTNANTWTRSDLTGFDQNNPHSSANPDSPDAPGAGDIVNIGFFPYDDPQTAYRGYPHSARLNNANDAEAAVLIFTQMTDAAGDAPVERKPISEIGGPNDFQFRPTLTWNSTGTILITSIQGEGTIRVRGGSTNNAQRDPDFSNVDLGLFINQDSAYLLYEAFNDYTINNLPDVVPNLTITNDGWGANNRSVTINKSFTVNQNLEIQGNSNLLLGSGATGDVTVGNNLYLRPLENGTGGGELQFANAGTGRNVTVEGNVYVGNPSGAPATGGNIIRVVGGGTVEHELSVYGDIILNTSGSNGGNGNGLQLGDGTGSVINLTLKGLTSNSFTNLSGDVPQLHRLKLNKGVNSANSFTFLDNFTLTGATNGAIKALTLSNGTLILDDNAINIDLTTNGDSFIIPGSSTLQITQGLVNARGNDSGLLLDGTIIIDGGTLDMTGAGNGNNFIQYSASGNATISISDGSLLVGSQIRGSLVTTTGVLNYLQTGGTVVVGENAAPEASRSVFEVHNTGSNFTYSGGTLTIVRQNTISPTVAAVRILPTFSEVSQPLYIGNAATPTNQNNIGINANIPLAGLIINGLNNPTATLQVNGLTLTDDLLINSGASFDANGWDLTLNADLTNDGTFIPSANNTIFNNPISQNIQGSSMTSFYDFEKSDAGSLEILDNNIMVNNLFLFTEGSINDNGNTIDLKGNAVIDGEHNSNTGTGNGIQFSGSSIQELQRSGSGTSSLGIMTITNANGVVIPEAGGFNYLINEELRMNGGTFNVGSSSITLGQNADVTTTTSFSVTNMVKTNSSFADNGLIKIFPAAYNQLFTFPIGEVLYTPVIVDMSVTGGTSGTTVGSIAAKPANEYHPTVNDGNDLLAGGDINNVLQYYWNIKSSSLNGFKGDIHLFYDQSQVSVADGSYTEADYIAARILNFNNPTNDINKYTADDLLDEATNVINFDNAVVFDVVNSNSIAGDYFAGIDLAIPDNVATYTSTGTGGLVTEDATFVESLPTPGSAPSGAVLVVSNGTEVDFNVGGVRLYKTIIEAGGVLNVDNTDGHRLGILEGTGTLKITSNTNSAPLPAADYGDFFSCTGGGLEYTGTGSYNVLPGITSLRSLVLSGSGNRNLQNDLTVCEDLTINGPTLTNNFNQTINIQGDLLLQNGDFSANAGIVNLTGDANLTGGVFNGQSATEKNFNGNVVINGGTLNLGTAGTTSVRGNLSLLSGSFSGGSATALLKIDGGSTQTFNGNFTTTDKFYRLEVNKSGGSVSLNGDIEISNRLSLNAGLITTGSNVVSFNAAAIVLPAAGRSNSFIDGKAEKVIAATNGNFTFPLGNGGRWRPASVKNVSTGGLTWDAQFFAQNVLDNPLVTSDQPTDDATITGIQLGEYWVVSDGATAPSGVTANVSLSWGTETDVAASSSDRQQLKIMTWNGTTETWDNNGGGNFSAGNTQDQGSFESASGIGFSENILAVGSSDPANPLPVELISFEAIAKTSSVDLLWSTASEKNNDFFEVQRSFDGTSFETIGIVEGSGTVLSQVDYDFVDANPLNGKSFYRLKQNDYDGNFEYSEIISVTIEVDSKLRLFPNPTTDRAIYLRLDGFHSQQAVEVEIFNLQGGSVFHQVLSPDDIYRKPLPVTQSLNPGIYILEVNQGETSKQVRLAIQ